MFTEQTWLGQAVSVLLFFIFILFYTKYMFYKIIADMEEVAETLEAYTKEAVELIVKTSKEKGSPEADSKGIIENVLEFFLIPPVALDPYGILTKIEYLFDKTEDRFEAIAAKIAPKSDAVWRAHIISLLKGGIGLNNIAKIVRHYVEFVKKTGNFQIAMLFQMNMPLVKKIAKAQMKGIKAIAEGKPIGDSIGPLVAANLIDDGVYEVAKNVVCGESQIMGRRVFIVKANGPGANLGKLGEAARNICSKNRVAKIITIDASVKLEGEKSGKVVEGIGAAIGDPGPEKAKIEEAAMQQNIPLEAYAVKMSVEEAISPLTKNIAESLQNSINMIKDGIERTPEGGAVLVIGVGNTCGIGNSLASVKDLKFPEKEEEKEEEGILDKFIKKLVKKSMKKI